MCLLLAFIGLLLPQDSLEYPETKNTSHYDGKYVMYDYGTYDSLMAQTESFKDYKSNEKHKFPSSTSILATINPTKTDLNTDSILLEVSEEEFDDFVELPQNTASFLIITSTDIKPVFHGSLLKPLLDVPPEFTSLI